MACCCCNNNTHTQRETREHRLHYYNNTHTEEGTMFYHHSNPFVDFTHHPVEHHRQRNSAQAVPTQRHHPPHRPKRVWEQTQAAAEGVAEPPNPASVPVPVPTAAAQEEAATSKPETPTFDGLQGVELCRAVCAWLMATAPKTGRDAESRLAAGEERLARLVHTLSTAGLLTGTAETAKCVEDFCAFLQGRYFDGITTDEHGTEARSRARNNNRLVEQLCSEQQFRAMADSMPRPADGNGPQDREEEPSDQAEPDCMVVEEPAGTRDAPEVEEIEVLEESGEDESEEEGEEIALEEEPDDAAQEEEEEDDDGDDEEEEEEEQEQEEQEEEEEKEEEQEQGQEQEEARSVSPEQYWYAQQLQQRQAQEDADALTRQRRCYQRHVQQQRQQRQAQEHAEALARQRRRYSDPFAAYHQQHPLFSSARPVGAWGVPQSRPRATIDRTRGGLGSFGFPVMLY